MIYNQWYIILDSKEVKKNKPLQVQRLNKTLAVWRNEQDEVCCVDDRCCHRGASLGCGRVVNGDIECPFHGFIFGKDGKARFIPANGHKKPIPPSMKVKAYSTYEAFGFIWLWYGDEDKKTAKPFFFEELAGYRYSTFADAWPVHYSRAIENQLDVVHLPFVHKTTIGRGNKTLVNGPVVTLEEDMLTFYVDNVKDDKQSLPLRPEEIVDYKNLFFLRFHFPNLWQNYISDKMRIVAAFVPIDEENTIIYLRQYQKITGIPGVVQLFNLLGRIGNRIILNQDKRVVITQLPKKSWHKMNERLIMGDLPIIEYRRRRQELIDANPPPAENR